MSRFGSALSLHYPPAAQQPTFVSTTMRSFALFTSVALLSPALGKVLSNKTPQFSEATLAKVQSNLAVIATHRYAIYFSRISSTPTHVKSSSWEIGTRETALFELNAPHAFVYEGTIPPKLVPGDNVTEIWESVDAVLAQKPAGILPFFSDGAAGDPASTFRLLVIAFGVPN